MSEQHAFVKIEKDIKAGTIPRLVLLCGKEDYLTDHYKRRLIDVLSSPAAREFDVTIFSREDFETEPIEAAMESLPIMSEKKIVVLDSLINDRGKLPTKSLELSSDGRQELMDIIERVPDSCIMIITAEKPVTTGDHSKQSSGARLKQLIKTVTKAGGAVYDFDSLDKEQLRSFVIKRFQKAGKTCTNDVLRSIVYDTGYGGRNSSYDLYLLDNDLKKIMAYSGTKDMVTRDDLTGILTVDPENNVFHMIEAMSLGRTDQALIDLNDLLDHGESVFAILSNLIRQLEIMLISRELLDDNNTMSQTLKYLEKDEKVNRFRAEKAARVASRFRSQQLKKMMREAVNVEDRIKSGIMSERLALECLIAGGLR